MYLNLLILLALLLPIFRAFISSERPVCKFLFSTEFGKVLTCCPNFMYKLLIPWGPNPKILKSAEGVPFVLMGYTANSLWRLQNTDHTGFLFLLWQYLIATASLKAMCLTFLKYTFPHLLTSANTLVCFLWRPITLLKFKVFIFHLERLLTYWKEFRKVSQELSKI